MRIAPAFPPNGPAVALGATLAAYSCGGSRGFEARASHRVPFSPLRSNWDRNETVTRARSKQRAAVLSIAYVNGKYFQLARWRNGNAGIAGYFTASLTMPSSSVSMAASAFCEAASPLSSGRR